MFKHNITEKKDNVLKYKRRSISMNCHVMMNNSDMSSPPSVSYVLA